jgi:HSP20 family protein
MQGKVPEMVEKTHSSGFWPQIYDPFRAFGARLAEWIAPASEASADADAYRISVEIPGVSEKDVEVTLDDGVLTMKGEKRTSREEKGETWFFSERQFGSFQRSFRLPPDADQARVEAAIRDGILTVTVAKRQGTDSPNARKVPISRT